MIGTQDRFSRHGIKAEHAQRGDDGAWSAPGQTGALAPTISLAKAGRGDVIDSFYKAAFFVRHNHYKALGKTGDIRSAATTRQFSRRFPRIAEIGCIEIAKTVYFSTADETQINTTLLKQAHDINHPRRPEGVCDIRRIAHRIEQFRGWRITHQAAFEQTDRIGSVCLLRQSKRNQRQTHAREHNLAIPDLPGGGGEDVAGRARVRPLVAHEATLGPLLAEPVVAVDQVVAPHPGLDALLLQVTLDAVGSSFAARIAEIVPTADPGSRTFVAKIALTQKGLKSGMFGRGSINLGTTVNGITVPLKAVIDRGAMAVVWTVDKENIARLRIVKVGRQTGERVEILSGLTDADRVVVTGVEKVTEGARVE